VLQEVSIPLSHFPPTPPEFEHNTEGEIPKINIKKIMGEHQEQIAVIPPWMFE
jgi:hypothetical protein